MYIIETFKLVFFQVEFNSCNGTLPDKLEHVQAEITLKAKHRGRINIVLESPSGTKSNLLSFR